MIVECKKCETKFRFDEAVISGEGAWVRCSVCKNIFFQDNPIKEKKAEIPPADPTAGASPAAHDGAGGQMPNDRSSSRSEDSPHPAAERFPGAGDREPAAFGGEPVVVMEERRAAGVDAAPSESRGMEPPGMPFAAAGEESVPEDGEGETWPEEDRKGSGFRRAALYLIVLVLVIGGLYLWLFSPWGGQGLSRSFDREALTEWASSLPLVDKIAGTSHRQKDFSVGQVRIQDLKQRVVKNMLLGDLRVVEGTALNQSPFVISKVQVRGRMYDAAGAALGDRVSSCGNVLTDEELASLTEDDMQKVLSLPQGRNTSNEQLAENARIPFMIVFANVPPGMAKITALPVGAERLLP
ncbi:MAG: zinc-ribbon domain-containing protein [Deltaproteobacteria bacterium]|nr:zinc-ribbon domain-containing protein [Deltaproteobacteria bacterium]